MSLALIWGIVNSCRSNMTKDMITNLKKIDRQKIQKISKYDIFWKIIFSGFKSYLWTHLTYRSMLYLKLKLKTFYLDLILSVFWLKSIFYERGSDEVVSFFFTQTLLSMVIRWEITYLWSHPGHSWGTQCKKLCYLLTYIDM